MKANAEVFSSIVSCRNLLIEGRITEEVLPILRRLLGQADEIGVLWVRPVVKRCAASAIEAVEQGELVSAGRLLNLIHNLPANSDEAVNWNLDYFLSIELPEFLDNYDEIASARDVALVLFSSLAIGFIPG